MFCWTRRNICSNIDAIRLSRDAPWHGYFGPRTVTVKIGGFSIPPWAHPYPYRLWGRPDWRVVGAVGMDLSSFSLSKLGILGNVV